MGATLQNIYIIHKKNIVCANFFVFFGKNLYICRENKEKYMEYTAIIEKMPSGWYIAQCEQVPGALTQGRTLEEVRENLQEAIFLVLEAERELGIRSDEYNEIFEENFATV